MIAQETLSIADVRSGMRLAVAVSDDAGRILVPAAVELTEGLLESLRRRGVVQLHVERVEALDPDVLAARRAKIESDVARLFRKAGDGRETQVLQQTIRLFRLGRGA